MVAAVDTKVSQSGVMVAAPAATDVRGSQAGVMAVAINPAQFAEVSQAGALAVAPALTDVLASQAGVMIVARGRTADPLIRAWKFTLDGHDFYVLRLGDNSTIVYDLASEQWVDWGTDARGAWRVNTGINWVGGQALGALYGSDVVVGDDAFGLIYFLNPEKPYDDTPSAGLLPAQISFTRVVTGQVLARGRDFLPCYAIFLDGDNYGFDTTDFVPSVTLASSDDQGRTFYDHDTLTGPAYQWTSLGQIASPGRIFRITDNGIFTRIDSLEMNDG